MCSISIKCDAQSKAWDILLVLTSVAGNLGNKCPSGYSNETAVKVILSMRSLVSIEQQSPRRPCDIYWYTILTVNLSLTVFLLFSQFSLTLNRLKLIIELNLMTNISQKSNVKLKCQILNIYLSHKQPFCALVQ